jgi:hypothetical protein
MKVLLYLGHPLWRPRDKLIAIKKIFTLFLLFSIFGHQNPESRSGIIATLLVRLK